MNNDNAGRREKDMKAQVMADIKQKKIKMRRRLIFVMEKLGLKGALLAMLLLGAVLVSLIFHFIAHIRLEKFLTLGFPGTRIFFMTLPYDYFLFFALAIVLAIYFANRLELFCGKCEHTEAFIVWFSLGALVLGIFFGMLGVGGSLGGWSRNKIPPAAAIHGKIKSFMDNEVTVVDEDGEVVKVFLPSSSVPPKRDDFIEDKFLRAVGTRDKHDPFIFHADRVRCCDDD